MDVKLKFDNEKTIADIGLGLNDVESEKSLRTAVIISLFTDSRDENQRGWWADADFGSKLWKLNRHKINRETQVKARGYALDALQWLVDDQIAQKVDVTTEIVGRKLKMIVNVIRPSGANEQINFSNIWDVHQTELENGI